MKFKVDKPKYKMGDVFKDDCFYVVSDDVWIEYEYDHENLEITAFWMYDVDIVGGSSTHKSEDELDEMECNLWKESI